MDVLTAEGITSGYGRSMIVHDVSARVTGGTITAIVGPNGAGKSTFAKTVVGVLRPQSGRIVLNDIVLSDLPAHRFSRNGLAYVPQNDNVFRTMSVRENLEVGGYVADGDPLVQMERVLEGFPTLAQAVDRKAGNLSGGQQNLLAMARALMARPRAIVLDEPTAGLSPAYTAVVWEHVQRIAAEGTAVLVIEQNVERALEHADDVMVMVAGRKLLDGPAAEIGALDLGAIFLGEDPGRPADADLPHSPPGSPPEPKTTPDKNEA